MNSYERGALLLLLEALQHSSDNSKISKICSDLRNLIIQHGQDILLPAPYHDLHRPIESIMDELYQQENVSVESQLSPEQNFTLSENQEENDFGLPYENPVNKPILGG